MRVSAWWTVVAVVALAAAPQARATEQPRTARVSLTAAGAQLPAGAWAIAVSDDGTRVLFRTTDGHIDLSHPNGGLFVRGIDTGFTRWAADLPAVAMPWFDPPVGLSGFGDTVAYVGTDGQVHAVDWASHTDEVASVDASGTPASGGADRPSISQDGRRVAFISAAILAAGTPAAPVHVYLRDRTTHQTTAIGLNGGESGLQIVPGPKLSGDGAHLVFATTTPLVPADTNGRSDVYEKDLATGAITLVSVGMSGGAADGDSRAPSVASDGTVVAFSSSAADLIGSDTDNHTDIFVRDLVAGTTVRAHPASTVENTSSTVSPDGRFVAVTSADPSFVMMDTNHVPDVFVTDRLTAVTTRVSVTYTDSEPNKPSFVAGLSDGGRIVLLSSLADLAQGDTNNTYDAYVRDRGTPCDDGGFEEGTVSQPVHRTLEPRSVPFDEQVHDANCTVFATNGR